MPTLPLAYSHRRQHGERLQSSRRPPQGAEGKGEEEEQGAKEDRQRAEGCQEEHRV